MTPQETDARKRILEATIEILNEADDPDSITVRQIASRANVGVGLINYHYQSKENLYQQAITAMDGELASQWENTLDPSIPDPVERLKILLKKNASMGINNSKFARVLVRHSLLHGDLAVCQVLLPVLREIMGADVPEQGIKMAAFMLVASLQTIFVRELVFRRYIGLDIYNNQQRDLCIDLMVDHLISTGKSK